MTLRNVALIVTLALGIHVAPLATDAQQPGKIPRVGILCAVSCATPSLKAFLQGLRELGYVEGRNIAVEYRWPQHREDWLPDLATELVQLKVDVIVALEPLAALAAKNTTRTTPVVIRSSGDPVAERLVASLARPGGNVTGLTSISSQLSAKRLELLREVVPRLSRVAVLWNPYFPAAVAQLNETEVGAQSLGVRLHSLKVRDLNEIESVLSAMTSERAAGLIVLSSPLIVAHQTRILNFAAKNRLPTMYDDREFVEAGGLMSYGANLADLYRRAASYVGKILKGAKPGDLPVEQPTKFELVINLKTAKGLGLTIPRSVLMRADETIQ